MPLDNEGRSSMEAPGSPQDGSVEPKGSGEPLGTLISLSINHLLTLTSLYQQQQQRNSCCLSTPEPNQALVGMLRYHQ